MLFAFGLKSLFNVESAQCDEKTQVSARCRDTLSFCERTAGLGGRVGGGQ